MILWRQASRPAGGDAYRQAWRPAATIGHYATVIAASRYTSWIACNRSIPSAIGRWNALRPEIRPMPPARLLITAVRTASAMSVAPEEAPPLLIRPARPR